MSTAKSPLPSPSDNSNFRPLSEVEATPVDRGAAITCFVLAAAVYWALIPIWPTIGYEGPHLPDRAFPDATIR